MARLFRFRDRMWSLGEKTYILAIMNVTPDSFSDGRVDNLDPAWQVDKAHQLLEQGADGLDLGAESTRPGHQPVPAEEEWARLGPVLEAVRRSLPEVPLSIDTQKSSVAARALDAGADIINDIWGLARDPQMASRIAAHRAGAVVMYNGTGIPNVGPSLAEVIQFLARQTETAVSAGIDREAILVDPGVGFRVQGDAAWDVLTHLPALAPIGAGVLVGHSRKRFLGALVGNPAPINRDGVTAALSALLAAHGADVLRVHNPSATREALQVARQWRSFHGTD